MKQCPACGKTFPGDYLFCSEDATELLPAPPAANVVPLPGSSGSQAISALADHSAPRDRSESRAAPNRLVATSFAVGILFVLIGTLCVAWPVGKSDCPLGNAATASQAASLPRGKTGTHAATGRENVGGWRTVRLEEWGFSLAVPAEWKEKPAKRREGFVRFRYEHPDERWVFLVIDIDLQRKGKPAKAVWRDLDARMEKGFKERYTRLALADASLDGAPAALWEMHLKRKNEPELVKLDLGADLADGSRLAILLAAPPDRIGKYRPVFDHAKESFRWTEPLDRYD